MALLKEFHAGMALLISSLACLHIQEVFKSHLSKYLAYWLFPLRRLGRWLGRGHPIPEGIRVDPGAGKQLRSQLLTPLSKYRRHPTWAISLRN